MATGTDRDPLAALRARLRDVQAEVDKREARLTDRFWAAIPHELAEPLRDLKARVDTSATTAEQLARSSVALDAYRARLDEAIAMAPSIAARLRAVPDSAPLPLPNVKVRGEIDEADLIPNGVPAQLIAAVRPFDPEAKISEVRTGLGPAWLSFFRAYGAPLALCVSLSTRGRQDRHNTMATSVAPGATPVNVRPVAETEKLLAELAASESEEGWFERLFVVEGQLTFDAPLRTAIVRLARQDPPTLAIGQGRATLYWRFDPAPDAVALAGWILAAIRQLPVDVELLR
jgi:hypothetical protein